MAKLRAIPFGYAVRDGKVIISPEDSETVIRIFREYIGGKSMHGWDTGKVQTASRKSFRKKPKSSGRFSGNFLTEHLPSISQTR